MRNSLIQWCDDSVNPAPGCDGWARDIRRQCADQGVAFFIKQLGQRSIMDGRQIVLKDPHGGDWTEWPEDLRVRQFPKGFRRRK